VNFACPCGGFAVVARLPERGGFEAFRAVCIGTPGGPAACGALAEVRIPAGARLPRSNEATARAWLRVAFADRAKAEAKAREEAEARARRPKRS
jgi:hypothetical protein